MAKRRTDTKRRDLATWLMMLLPGFMFVGLLAPAAVKVKPKADDEIGPISFRNFAPRRPIQFALPVGQSLLRASSGLEPVFAGARYVADPARPPTLQPDVAAPPEAGGEIVLAEDESVENYVAETLFETPIEDQQYLAVDLTSLWEARFNEIPDMIDRTGAMQWDDFHGTGTLFASTPAANPVVPEPASGALLATGLAALAMRSRRAPASQAAAVGPATGRGR